VTTAGPSAEAGELSLSVVIPVFNERQTLPLMLQAVQAALPGTKKQIVVVDDGSTDGTRDWLVQTFGLGRHTLPESKDDIQVVFHERNGGKGMALRTGIAAANCDLIVVQDADLEYDPADWSEMYALFQRGVADVVYGSRFYGRPHRVLYFYHLLGNKIITWLFNALFNQTLSDLETCYKMFRRTVVENVNFRSNDFGIEVELGALFATTKRCRIYETGIRYFGRTYDEGKKIGWRDGLKALWYVVLFRFAPPRQTVRR
jgi:glycosyltransferase involved in cell wall biosynthesis